ncbi:MAG TPA: hypothetical protein VFU64_06865 [Gaiellaceae bacterium]|nr:hypothetical protein [Gaiellaceae bacterium]
MGRALAAEQLQIENPVAERSPTRERDASDQNRRLKASDRLSAAELLKTPGALLTRTHLRGLGLERRAVDAVFRALPVVALPGYSRPMVRVEDYVHLIERNTYRDDRVRPV